MHIHTLQINCDWHRLRWTVNYTPIHQLFNSIYIYVAKQAFRFRQKIYSRRSVCRRGFQLSTAGFHETTELVMWQHSAGGYPTFKWDNINVNSLNCRHAWTLYFCSIQLQNKTTKGSGIAYYATGKGKYKSICIAKAGENTPPPPPYLYFYLVIFMFEEYIMLT